MSYAGLAHDLTALARFHQDNWDVVAHKTTTEPSDIQRALQIAGELLRVVAMQHTTVVERRSSALLRRQAFTLFANAYDELRHVVTFLRWHHRDAGELVPSLYNGRGNAPLAPRPGVPGV